MFGANDNRAGRRKRRRLARPSIVGAVSALVALLGCASVVLAARSSTAPTGIIPQTLAIHATPSAQTITAGGIVRYGVKITRFSSGHTTLTTLGALPPGVTFSFLSASFRSNKPGKSSHPAITLTVATSSTTPAGTYPIRIQAQHRGKRGKTIVRLTVLAAPGAPEPTGATAPAVVTPPIPAPPTAAPPAPTPPDLTPEGFTVSGSLPTPFAPGVEQALDLSLTNTQSFDLTITALTVGAGNIIAPGATLSNPCGAADFSFGQFSGAYDFTLPASSTFTLEELGFAPSEWPTVAMLDRPVNQDGCKNASLKLAFSGTARGAEQ